MIPLEISIGLALEPDECPASAPLKARLEIRNSTDAPETLSFPTAQMYDLEIRDGEGNVVCLWSRGRTFAQAATALIVQYEKDFLITVPPAGLQPGRYVAQAWLTLDGPPRAYSASARLEITRD